MCCRMEIGIYNKLKSQDIHEAFDALLLIRDYYLDNDEKMAKLRKYPVIQFIIHFLNYPPLFNLSLDIIQSLCHKKIFVNEIIKQGGVKTLARIMDSTDESYIRASACLVLGTMIEYGSEFESVNIEEILSIVNNYLYEFSVNNCENKLLKFSDKRLEIGLRTLGTFGKFPIIKKADEYRRSIFNIAVYLKSSVSKVLLSVCQCIAHLTRRTHSFGEIENPKRKEILKDLVRLCFHPQLTVQIYSLLSLKNISFDESLTFDLIEVGTVKVFSYILLNAKSQLMKQFIALAFCNFLNPLVLNVDKNGDIYSALMHILDVEIYDNVCLNIIYCLTPVHYISKVVNDLLNFGCLNLLVKILVHFIKQNSRTIYNDINQTLPTTAPEMCLEGMFVHAGQFTDIILPTSNYKSRVLSNSSASVNIDDRSMIEADQFPGTPFRLPFSFIQEKIDRDIMDELFNDIMPLFSWINTHPAIIDQEILRVIQEFCFCCPDKVLPIIAHESVFSALLDYLHLIDSPSPMAENIIMRIMKDRMQFKNLIRNGFLLKLEEKLELTNSVNQLNFQFLMQEFDQEAAKLQDHIYYEMLLTRSWKSKFYVLCAAAKYVKNISGWNDIIFRADGLNILINILLDNCSTTSSKRAVVALCQLYQHFKSEYEEKCMNESLKQTTGKKLCKNETDMKIVDKEDDYMRRKSFQFSKCSYMDSYFNVIVVTENGEKIKANMDKLCRKSKYFRDIILRNSKENCSNFTWIKIEKCYENMWAIFHYIHGCRLNSACLDLKIMPFLQLLELLTDCYEFLLSDLKTIIEDEICSRMNPFNIYDVFVRSKLYDSPKLTKMSLEYGLSLSVNNKYTIEVCFGDLINLAEYFKFPEDIKDIIMDLVSKVNEMVIVPDLKKDL